MNIFVRIILSYFQIDLSKTPFINTIWICKPASELIVKIIILLPVVLLGISGNLFVLYVLLKNQHIRTPTNLLIGNMAGADLLSTLVHPWLFLLTDYFQNYPFGRIGCQGEGAIECKFQKLLIFLIYLIYYFNHCVVCTHRL